MVAAEAIPLIVNVPEVAVRDPSTIADVLIVTADVLAMPLTVKMPELAVMDPK